MDVEMRYFLIGIDTMVGEQPIARSGDASFARDMTDRAHQRHNLSLRRVGTEVIGRNIGSFRDYQDMGRGLRSNVVERQNMIVLIGFLAGNFTAKNARENIVRIIGHVVYPCGLPNTYSRAQ